VERLCDSICLIDHGKAVLQGDLKQIKTKFGRHDVQLKYEGEDNFLRDGQLVRSFNNYGNYVEVRLQPGADPQDLLRRASSRARVDKFELMEPSLEQIFLEVVGRSDA
jgi:ABC-2 type transport system ATP-binding protein